MNRIWLPCVILCVVMSSPVQAITSYQIDDFQSEPTTLGWVGSASLSSLTTGPPTRQDNGQGGSGDYFLHQTTSGYHLATHNPDQWSGDYLSAGVDAIELDINHLTGTDPVELRIAVTGPGGFFSSTATTPVAPGQWKHYVFGLTDADLIHVSGGTGSLADTLSAVNKLLIRHDIANPPSAPGSHPQHITATIGFDNIRAIPEPSTLTLAIAGLLGLYAYAWRRRGP